MGDTFAHICSSDPSSDTMSRDQLNQKLKLMVEAPVINLYSIIDISMIIIIKITIKI